MIAREDNYVSSSAVLVHITMEAALATAAGLHASSGA